jgi:hypothetical protein
VSCAREIVHAQDDVPVVVTYTESMLIPAVGIRSASSPSALGSSSTLTMRISRACTESGSVEGAPRARAAVRHEADEPLSGPDRALGRFDVHPLVAERLPETGETARHMRATSKCRRKAVSIPHGPYSVFANGGRGAAFPFGGASR